MARKVREWGGWVWNTYVAPAKSYKADAPSLAENAKEVVEVVCSQSRWVVIIQLCDES